MQNTDPAYQDDITFVAQGQHIRDPMIHDLHSRVTKLEHSTSEARTNIAVLLNDLSYVKREVTGISKGINRVLWSIGLSVIGAIATFILSGGITIVQP